MATKFMLDGSIVPRAAMRRIDERIEDRIEASSQTAVLEVRGRKHVVRLVNISDGGAMVIFSLIPNIGETITMQLIGRGKVMGRVCWARDGRIGVSFAAPKEL
jgi:hypothetical protein